MLLNSYDFGFSTEYFVPITKYEYENNKVVNDSISYKKYEIDNKTVKITMVDGEILSKEVGDTYVRFMSAEEILEIASFYNPNLEYDNLQKILNDNIDGINYIFMTAKLITEKAKNINDLLDKLNMDNDWKSLAIFSLILSSNLDIYDTDLSLPDFFGTTEDELWYTLSSSKIWNDVNVVIKISVENNKPYLDFTEETTATDDDGYKPVLRVSKETLREALN